MYDFGGVVLRGPFGVYIIYIYGIDISISDRIPHAGIWVFRRH